MKILDVFYYDFYILYSKYIPDPTPEGTAIYCLGISMGYPLMIFVDYVLSFIGVCIGKLFIPVLLILPAFILYLLYWRTKRYKQVVKKKPKFFNSQKISQVIVYTYLLLSISVLFWGPIVVKDNSDRLWREPRPTIEDIISDKIFSNED